MITLKNVSKYYYQKGVIASGFIKLNLHLTLGEFVAITGESGSGKSTLLNVISGLDSYEEGEMLINGQETSHYTERDFENYRRTYISNIFQNFNLINSYTVFQNIELVLLINGATKKEAATTTLELIQKVGLTKYKNTKASKLSGGQKQRVAIARALAKETPIIIADEPTGNLDKKSAKEILKLLHQISSDKLVIVVTHNYDQIAEYVTRKITMHDGRILEDKKLSPPTTTNLTINKANKHLTLISKLRLGIRNTFNIIPKFLLILFVYFFIVIAVMSEYAFFQKQEYTASINGYNRFFLDNSDTRLILKKADHSFFTDTDYQTISQLPNVDYLVKNDLFLDTTVDLRNHDNFYFSANLYDITNFTHTPDLGRLPTSANEIILAGSADNYYLNYMATDILDKEVSLIDLYDQEYSLKVVGIYYEEPTNYLSDGKIYADNSLLEQLTFQINRQYSDLKILFQNHYHNSYLYDIHYQIIANANVPEGSAYISDDLSYLCPNENCLNQPLAIEVHNLYYQDTLNLTVTKTYTKKNIETLLAIKDYNSNNGAIFINPTNYQQLFTRPNYQSSIFIQDITKLDTTTQTLTTAGYQVLKVKDTLITDSSVQILKIIRTLVTITLVITLFFISYFVIRIILKSRNTYFGTIRILGTTKKEAKQLLEIELFTVSNLAFLLMLFLLVLQQHQLITVSLFNIILKYLKVLDYLLLYFIVTSMSYLISLRFSRKIFKQSAMSTMREEV